MSFNLSTTSPRCLTNRFILAIVRKKINKDIEISINFFSQLIWYISAPSTWQRSVAMTMSIKELQADTTRYLRPEQDDRLPLYCSVSYKLASHTAKPFRKARNNAKLRRSVQVEDNHPRSRQPLMDHVRSTFICRYKSRPLDQR